jgi:hypothetical protein
MKRYEIVIQHEVIIYAENEKAAECSLYNNQFLRNRTNLICISITELPMPEDEGIPYLEDHRKAPGG